MTVHPVPGGGITSGFETSDNQTPASAATTRFISFFDPISTVHVDESEQEQVSTTTGTSANPLPESEAKDDEDRVQISAMVQTSPSTRVTDQGTVTIPDRNDEPETPTRTLHDWEIDILMAHTTSDDELDVKDVQPGAAMIMPRPSSTSTDDNETTVIDTSDIGWAMEEAEEEKRTRQDERNQPAEAQNTEGTATQQAAQQQRDTEATGTHDDKDKQCRVQNKTAGQTGKRPPKEHRSDTIHQDVESEEQTATPVLPVHEAGQGQDMGKVEVVLPLDRGITLIKQFVLQWPVTTVFSRPPAVHDDRYRVEKVGGVGRCRRGKCWLCIKWSGYPWEEATWVRASDVDRDILNRLHTRWGPLLLIRGDSQPRQGGSRRPRRPRHRPQPIPDGT